VHAIVDLLISRLVESTNMSLLGPMMRSAIMSICR